MTVSAAQLGQGTGGAVRRIAEGVGLDAHGLCPKRFYHHHVGESFSGILTARLPVK